MTGGSGSGYISLPARAFSGSGPRVTRHEKPVWSPEQLKLIVDPVPTTHRNRETQNARKCVIPGFREQHDAWDSLETVKAVCVHVAAADANSRQNGLGKNSAVLAADSALT